MRGRECVLVYGAPIVTNFPSSYSFSTNIKVRNTQALMPDLDVCACCYFLMTLVFIHILYSPLHSWLNISIVGVFTVTTLEFPDRPAVCGGLTPHRGPEGNSNEHFDRSWPQLRCLFDFRNPSWGPASDFFCGGCGVMGDIIYWSWKSLWFLCWLKFNRP